MMYLFTTGPHAHGHLQLQELLGNQPTWMLTVFSALAVMEPGLVTRMLDPEPAVASLSVDQTQGRMSNPDTAILAMVYAAKLLCYYMVQFTAMRADVTQLAAHNTLFSLWNVFAYVPVPLQSTALAFMPSAQSQKVRFCLLS